MTDLLSPTALLIHVASLLALLGMMMRDQMALRALVLAGGCFEMAYYWFYPASPLWPSIIWALLIGLTNAFVMVRIWQDRREGRMSAEERELFVQLSGLSPGEFRRLRALARREEGGMGVLLTTEGVETDRLYFVHRGDILIAKGGREFWAFPPAFIGEVSLLLGGPATATVTMPEGGLRLSWRRAELEAFFRKEPGVQAAFQRILNRDMAGKVARS